MLELIPEPLTYFFDSYTRAIICFASLCLLVFSFVYYLNFRKVINTLDKIPGPRYSQIMGKLLGNMELLWTMKDVPDPIYTGLEIVLGLSKIYQHNKTGLFRAWLGPFEQVLVLFRSDTVEPILNSSVHIEKAPEYKFFEPWLGLGLLTSTGDRWRSHRKLLTPSFHFKILENFVPVINGQQKIMIDIIEKEIKENNGIVEDIRPVITNCALDTICETAMGVTVNAQTNPNSDYVESVRNALVGFLYRLVRPWLWNPKIYNLSLAGNQFKQNASVLHKFTDSVIKERKTEFLKKIEKDKSIERVVTDIGSKRRLAFLDSLLIHHLKNPKEFTELDIREEVDTFMFEGHDTTSSALTFTLWLIGHNQEVQTKIHEELDDIFSDDINRDITLEDLRNMRYLEQCVKEGLRLYPSVPYIARKNNEPFFIGNYEIPKNTTCLVLFYMLHRDPDVFPNPEVFDPNRFSSDAGVGRHPFAYVPFSAGPRNCIGQKFAMLEEKALLASILRIYRIKALTQLNDVKVDKSIILKPLSQIKMQFENRFTK